MVLPSTGADAGAPVGSVGAFDYGLPPELIAQTPAPSRDAARLLVLERAAGALVHGAVGDLPAHLRPGDLLILNDTRVRRARLAARTATGGAVELLLVAELSDGAWQCLGKPAKRLRPGTELQLPDGRLAAVVARLGAGRYAVRLGPPAVVDALLGAYGELPLPPYIHRPDGPLAVDHERYQTVFARADGAIAAPTAGLHFTPALLAAVRAAGVEIAWLTLHVGPGTFLPVRCDDVRHHRMEPERAEIPAATAAAVTAQKRAGRRIVAVGTTTVRALESAARSAPAIEAGPLLADAFIVPGFHFRVVDALLTNFHLPRSTLLMLVSAFAGRERMLAAYAEAVARRYRFYSYGDAMLIV